MTVFIASAALNATAFNTLLDINGDATPHIVNAHLLVRDAPPYEYRVRGTFTNTLNPSADPVTSVTVYNTTPDPDRKLYALSGLDVTVGQIEAADTTVKLENLFFAGNDTIIGSNLADTVINGFGGNDRITGRGGNDIMKGGTGDDTFVFKAGFGKDTIKDFNGGTTLHHDTIELHSITGLTNWTLVHGNASAASGHVVITDTAGDSITFSNLTAVSQLHSFDFHFVV